MTELILVINPNSAHLGSTLDEVRMPDRYGVQVLAIQRHGAHLPVTAGDAALQSAYFAPL